MAPLTLAVEAEGSLDHALNTRQSSGAATTSTCLGIGIGVGGAILLAVTVVIIQIVRKRSQHRREVEELQVEQAVHSAQCREIGEIPRPVTSVRCSTFGPLNGRAGWGALSSDDTIHSAPASGGKKSKRSSVSLPKRFKQRGMQLRRLKRLTAIIESPRSRAGTSPTIAKSGERSAVHDESVATPEMSPKAYTLRMVSDEDVFVCPGSPKPHVLPSFAIRSPGRYGSGIALSDTQKAARSQSVGALMIPPAAFSNSFPPRRPAMHSRSLSLGAPTTRPPTGPVPPLPVSSSHADATQQPSRHGMLVSRMSSSSNESTSSSVLVTSPILTRKDNNQPLGSPCVEKVVADDDAASLKTVSQRQWSSPTLGPHGAPDGIPPVPNTVPLRAHHSIRANIARYSIQSQDSSRLSLTSVGSTEECHNRLSIPQIGTADRVSISRVSSASSLSSIKGVRKVTTPRRAARVSVSESGSPAERKKTSVLRDISGNSNGAPTRQASNATNNSSRSSNGNPFQWDNQPLPKPSALKGSPNARKGHRRQNCVRISTLTPQILGPPPSRPTSPGIMHGIEEEGGDGEESDSSSGLRFVSNQRPSRPTSAGSFAQHLRVQTLRASITPSSPTLSAWNAFQEHGLPSEHSDSSFSVSPDKRSNSRLSTVSALSIPTFPSPVKASVSNVQLQQPIPEFCLSRPSTDTYEEYGSSPFVLHNSSDSIEFPSSPPLPASSSREYDPAHPAWPLVTLPAPPEQEYDPASPPRKEDVDPEHSSPYLPFAQNLSREHDEISPRSRPVSYANGTVHSDSPPCSPKTLPEGFTSFYEDRTERPRAAEKLTSENASAMAAKIPTPKRTVDFPGAPVLAPPSDEMDAFASASKPSPPPKSAARCSRAVSSAAGLQPMRPAPPPPAASNESCVVSPLHIGSKTTERQQSPQGPRAQPAQSVLKNAMALRRMNSEVNCSPSMTNLDRESRRYVRLGREASPLLPWIGSPDLNDGMNAVFDFDLAASSDTGTGAYVDDSSLAVGISDGIMDDINIAEIERKLDGALAGFDALPHIDASHDTITSLGAVEKSVRQTSVWEDGERYWEDQENGAPELLDVTPVKRGAADRQSHEFGWASIQCTPRSLYDSDRFLRT